MDVVVIGGGAAGFFTAVNIAEKNPNAGITILEKSNKLLQKVKVSGGGRCNVTNARSKPSELVPFYPRGNKKLHSLFRKFTTSDLVDWLRKHEVDTKTEDDLRMFPSSDSSQTIVDCFLKIAKEKRIQIIPQQTWTGLQKHGERWKVSSKESSFHADRVIVTTGASPSSWQLLQEFGLNITQLVPSLFTFNIKDPRISGLQGITFENASVKITGTKLQEVGSLLITHWGLSGPAILKLSSWGAFELHENDYHFEILVNYLDKNTDKVRSNIIRYGQFNPKRKVGKYPLFDLPKRFWEQLVDHLGISKESPYGELSKKHINKLAEELTQGRYRVSGKSTFKEEFVTAGGVDLSEINLDTFECKRFPGLYLAGEVLDIDALTGGFNFQACWSVGWVISENFR